MQPRIAQSEADLSEPPAAGAELRARLGKLIGMLGSAHSGEKQNALAAIEKTLAGAGLTWASIGRLVARGELPGGERENLFSRVVRDRMKETLPRAWAINTSEARLCSNVLDACDGTRFAELDTIDLRRAIEISERARKRAR